MSSHFSWSTPLIHIKLAFHQHLLGITHGCSNATTSDDSQGNPQFDLGNLTCEWVFGAGPLQRIDVHNGRPKDYPKKL